MLKIPGALLGFLLVCLASPLLAQDVAPSEAKPDAGPVPIEGSSSPDGKKDITITDTSSEGMASGTALIREKDSGRSLDSFEWAGFGAHAGADAFTVLWRPDGRAFAIASEITRGYVECKVYTLLTNGHCREVKLPDFVAQVAGKYHLESREKGGEHPRKWLPGNLLVVEAFNRGWTVDDNGGSYAVTLHLIDEEKRRPKSTVRGIRPAKPLVDSWTGTQRVR